MKKYYSLINSILFFLLNIFFWIFLLTTKIIIIEKSFLIYFYSFLPPILLGYYLLDLKYGKLFFFKPIYFCTFPKRRLYFIKLEVQQILKDYKFYLSIIPTIISLLIIGHLLNIAIFITIFSLVITISFSLSFFLLIRHQFQFMQGNRMLSILYQILYFFAITPALVVIYELVNQEVDFFTKFYPFGGLFLAIFLYGGCFRIIATFEILICMCFIVFLYRKIEQNWIIL